MQQKRTPSVTRASAFPGLGSSLGSLLGSRPASGKPASVKASSIKPGSVKVAAHTPRASVISRHRLADPQAIAASAQKLGASALESGTQAAKTGLKSGLRFWQFLRAYMKAFAVGMGGYLLVPELASGHFNIVAMIGMHLFSIIAAPFYALMLAPAIFGLYNSLAATGLPSRYRAYAVGCTLGAVMLMSRIGLGQFLIDGDFSQDAAAVGITLCGALAAYTFNRGVDRIAATEPEAQAAA